MAVVKLAPSAEGVLYREHNLPCSPIRYEVVYDHNVVPAPYYVNVYERYREYGGPEEGGWWYDSGTVVHSEKFDNESDAETCRDNLRITYPNSDNYTSVVYSGGDYIICIENEPGRNYPENRPHYE
jgi:hypothetical protein